jgi:acyl carrier protein
MAANPAQILAEIGEMVHIVSDHILPDEPITMDSRLVADLALQSIELVSLVGRIRARYGAAANLATFVAGLGSDSLTDLRIGQLVEFLAGALDAGEADAVQPGDPRRHGSGVVSR